MAENDNENKGDLLTPLDAPKPVPGHDDSEGTLEAGDTSEEKPDAGETSEEKAKKDAETNTMEQANKEAGAKSEAKSQDDSDLIKKYGVYIKGDDDWLNLLHAWNKDGKNPNVGRYWTTTRPSGRWLNLAKGNWNEFRRLSGYKGIWWAPYWERRFDTLTPTDTDYIFYTPFADFTWFQIQAKPGVIKVHGFKRLSKEDKARAADEIVAALARDPKILAKGTASFTAGSESFKIAVWKAWRDTCLDYKGDPADKNKPPFVITWAPKPEMQRKLCPDAKSILKNRVTDTAAKDLDTDVGQLEKLNNQIEELTKKLIGAQPNPAAPPVPPAASPGPPVAPAPPAAPPVPPAAPPVPPAAPPAAPTTAAKAQTPTATRRRHYDMGNAWNPLIDNEVDRLAKEFGAPAKETFDLRQRASERVHHTRNLRRELQAQTTHAQTKDSLISNLKLARTNEEMRTKAQLYMTGEDFRNTYGNDLETLKNNVADRDTIQLADVWDNGRFKVFLSAGKLNPSNFDLVRVRPSDPAVAVLEAGAKETKERFKKDFGIDPNDDKTWTMSALEKDQAKGDTSKNTKNIKADKSSGRFFSRGNRNPTKTP